jgi:hypothetical protein
MRISADWETRMSAKLLDRLWWQLDIFSTKIRRKLIHSKTNRINSCLIGKFPFIMSNLCAIPNSYTKAWMHQTMPNWIKHKGHYMAFPSVRNSHNFAWWLSWNDHLRLTDVIPDRSLNSSSVTVLWFSLQIERILIAAHSRKEHDFVPNWIIQTQKEPSLFIHSLM